MRIEAIKSFPYGGKRWRTGDIDEVRNDHARVLIATRKAKRAPYVAQPVAAPVIPPVVEQEAPALAKDEPEGEAPKKRTYKRRDLTAEE